MKRNLAQLSNNVYDVVIIGGGIYGLFVAWDAILRGLSVALVEKADFGHATSSNSLRVIHGGLRYLQHGDIVRLRQSIRERGIFMRIAPHLVHPLPFLIPTYHHWLRGKEILSLALRINDLIGFDRNRLQDPGKHLPSGRAISRQECMELFPGVETKGLTGGVITYDCQMKSSERLMMAVARSASEAGAALANYVEVTGFMMDGSSVKGASVRDALTGETFDIQARLVINTTGPWLDRILGLVNGVRSGSKLVLSKAFNILVNRQFVKNYAVGIYSQGRYCDRDAILKKGYRLFFIAPWQDQSLIGTVHLPYDSDPDNFKITEDEIQDSIHEINRAYPAANLKRDEVSHVFGGLLPMAGSNVGSGDVRLVKHYRVRDHSRQDGINGLISVMGVKFTEARHVAEKTVDLAFKKFGRNAPKSTSAVTPLYGGNIGQFDSFLTDALKKKATGLSEAVIQALVFGYGSAYEEVLKYNGGPRQASSGQRDAASVMRAIVLHGIHEEMAQKLTDVILRRTPFRMPEQVADPTVRTAATVMSEELGWDEGRKMRELEDLKAQFAVKGS